MTEDNNTAIDAIQIDEDILSYTVSDEALEAAAGTERTGTLHLLSQYSHVSGLGVAHCC
jgi:hypothetical protein